MSPYLDAGFVLTTLVATHGTPLASRLLRHFEGPFHLNLLHQLQVEGLIVGLENAPEVERKKIGAKARALWQHHLTEGVYQIAPIEWDQAWRRAIIWVKQHTQPPPPVLLILHPAIAFGQASSHFLSFDPRSRALAKSQGMRILPERGN
jgi:hypothetical protein